MLMIPKPVYAKYIRELKSHDVPAEQHQEYLKWLRYYLDFCVKYVVIHDQAERVRLFLEKLRQKGQSDSQCQSAVQAVSLYRGMEQPHVEQGTVALATVTTAHTASNDQEGGDFFRRPSMYNEKGYQEKSSSPEWDEVIGKLADEIKVRHYSRKTLKTYALWSRQFQRFLKDKPPSELTTEDVKDYLTFLAVKCHVAASTQNQAFLIAG